MAGAPVTPVIAQSPAVCHAAPESEGSRNKYRSANGDGSAKKGHDTPGATNKQGPWPGAVQTLLVGARPPGRAPYPCTPQGCLPRGAAPAMDALRRKSASERWRKDRRPTLERPLRRPRGEHSPLAASGYQYHINHYPCPGEVRTMLAYDTALSRGPSHGSTSR